MFCKIRGHSHFKDNQNRWITKSIKSLEVEGINKRNMRFDFGGDDEETKTTTQTQTYTPTEYKESEAARGNWWDTLKNWGSTGNYGVNTSIYDDIYSNAANKINQYYWGSGSGGGLVDKIRASAARRGVSESPATDVLTQRMGVEQAGQLGDLATTVGTNKANAIENARSNWLNSLMNLSNLKSGGYTSSGTATQTTPVDNSSDWANLVGSIIGVAGNAAMGNYIGAGSSGLSALSSLLGNKSNSSGVSDSFADLYRANTPNYSSILA